MHKLPLFVLLLAVSLLLGSCAVPADPGGMLAAPLGGPSPEVLGDSPADMLGLPAYARPGEGDGMDTNKETAP